MLYTDEVIKERKNKITSIKKKISTTVYIILLPLLIYNISLIFIAFLNPNKTPGFMGYKTYVIISGSMEPELKVGDLVIVKEKYDSLKQGDVISFRRGQAVITHRISEIVTEENITKYRTKGDNNNTEDISSITTDKIEGKVVGKIPYVGKITLALKNKVTIITIVIIYYIYLLREQSVQRKKNLRKIKRAEYSKEKGE